MGLVGIETRIPNETNESDNWAAVESVPYSWHRRYAIPLTSNSAFSYYLDHLAMPHSWLEMAAIAFSRGWPWLGRLLLRAHGKTNNHARLNGPQPGVLRTLTAEGRLLEGEIHSHLRRAGLEPTGLLTFLTLNDHENVSRGLTVAFLFDDLSESPLAVAKLSAAPSQGSALKHEYKTLRRLFPGAGTDGFGEVPQPLAFFTSSPWTVVLQSCLPGRTAYLEMRRSWNALRLASHHLSLAWKWLVSFQGAADLTETRIDESVIFDYVEQPLRKLATRGRMSPEEVRLIEHTRDLARGIAGTRLVLTACHGDFWAGNLVVHKNSVGVIDWEQFVPEASPFDDLFFFTTTYGLNYPWKLAHWAAPEAAFRATYLQATDIADLVRKCLLDYCRRMRLAPELLEVFFPVFLARRALEEASCETENALDGRSAVSAATASSRQSDRNPECARSGMWRSFFRIYAEHRGPSCFTAGPQWREVHR